MTFDRVTFIVVGLVCALVVVRGIVPALARGESALGATIAVAAMLAALFVPALVLRLRSARATGSRRPPR